MRVGIYDLFKNAIKRLPAKPHQVDFSERYIPYGTEDAFPLKLAQAIQNSVTASACAETKSKFVRGDKFSEDALNNLVINKTGETFLEFHARMSDAITPFETVAAAIKYNPEGKIVGVYCIPHEYCRLGKPDAKGFIYKIKYNPFFGTGEEQIKDTEEYDVFNPDPQIVLSQIARAGKQPYKGQILYWGRTTPMSRFYSYPAIASAMNWMKIEANISEFHNKNLENGFFQSVILKLIGDPNQPSSHPNDQYFDEATQSYKTTKTLGERFNEEMQMFSGSLRVGNVMAMWAANKDEWPTVEPFPTNGNQEFFTALSTEAIDKIALSFNVPAILANIQRGATLGGDANQIRLAVKLMQSRVRDQQTTLINLYKKILPNMVTPYNGPIEIVNYNPFPEMEPIDANVWQVLRDDERRQYIKENTKYPITEQVKEKTKVKTEGVPPEQLQAQAQLRGSVGGVQGILSIQEAFASGRTSELSAITILKEIYGFDEDTSRDLLGLESIEKTPPQPAASFKNMLFTDYPEAAKKNAKRALDTRAGNPTCMTKMGWERTENIANGLPLSYQNVKRVYRYLDKIRWAKDKLMNESCEAVQYMGWGGEAMYQWSAEKIKSIEQ